MTAMHQPPSSLYGVEDAGSSPATTSSVMRLALDRQRVLEFSLRHHRYPPPSTAGLLDPSAFCLPVNSTTPSSAELMENWNTLRHQSHPAVLPGWTSGITDFSPYLHYGAVSGLDVRRKNATRESTSTLKAWLCQHIKNPYPTKGEKIMLAIVTRMTLTQVSTWFANARRRLKKENKMQWSPRQRSADDEVDDVDDDVDDDVIETRHDVNVDSDDDVTSYLATNRHCSPASTPACDATKPAIDSAFSLPPSRAPPTSADHLLPGAARSRDEDRSTKPRIWSLVELATSSDYRPKRADHAVSAEFRHSAEFRPWRATETETWESATSRVGVLQTAGNVSVTPSIRWHQNSVTTH